MKARGEKDEDVCDDWDKLLAFVDERATEREDLYYSDFVNKLDLY